MRRETVKMKVKYDTLTNNINWSFGNAWLSKKELWKRVYTYNTIKFLATIAVGKTLNICCGLDPTGDVKADIDIAILKQQKTNFGGGQYIRCDLHHLPFKPLSFDTVICDPPFNYYNKFKWVQKLANLARQRLILSTPAICIKLGKEWDKRYFAIETGGIFLRLWQVFFRRGSPPCKQLDYWSAVEVE